MTEICPRCRRVPPENESLCPNHGLYAISDQVLAQHEDARLLGHALDGRYVLVGVIGGGGMGVVYEGLQLPLRRTVAVKVLHANLTATQSDRDRFQREAEAMSRLASPHTVTLFDYGLVQEGPLADMAYMVLERVQGGSLDAWLQRAPLTPAVAADVVDGVAHSVSEAHLRGIIHRDLKPANILLTQGHDGRLVVKVIDFGIARIEGATQTGSGVLIGTPRYMAPEQCGAGDYGPPDGRIDVYAMGIVLFEMLSGQCPFSGLEPIQTLMKQLHEPLPRLPGADEDPVLRAVEPVIRRAAAKKPDDRFATIDALARAFRAAVGGEVAASSAVPSLVGALRPSGAATDAVSTLSESAGQLPTSHLSIVTAPVWRRGWALALAALVITAGGIVIAVWPRPPSAPPPDLRPVTQRIGDPLPTPAHAARPREAASGPERAAHSREAGSGSKRTAGSREAASGPERAAHPREAGSGWKRTAGSREAASGSERAAHPREAGSGSKRTAGSREAASGSERAAHPREAGSGSKRTAGSRQAGSGPERAVRPRETGSEPERAVRPQEAGSGPKRAARPQETGSESERAARPRETGSESERAARPRETGSESERAAGSRQAGSESERAARPRETGSESERAASSRQAASGSARVVPPPEKASRLSARPARSPRSASLSTDTQAAAPTGRAPARLPRARAQPKSRSPKTPTAAKSPDVATLGARIDQALRRCRCPEAKRLFDDLQKRDEKHARRLEWRINGCMIPDVDELCVDGQVKRK